MGLARSNDRPIVDILLGVCHWRGQRACPNLACTPVFCQEIDFLRLSTNVRARLLVSAVFHAIVVSPVFLALSFPTMGKNTRYGTVLIDGKTRAAPASRYSP